MSRAIRGSNIYPARAAAVIIVVVALALVFTYRLAFTDFILARGDTYAYFYPYWLARDSALASGALPLWTPDLFMGAPLLANSQLGTLYPPNWLTIPLDPPQAVIVSIVLHLAWATLGAALLARHALGLAVLPALVAGVLYGFGGHLSAHVEQINQLHGLAWLPWLFLLFDGARRAPGRWLPLLALAWGLQLLSGHTQTVFISGVGLGVYGILVSVFGGAASKPASKLVPLFQKWTKLRLFRRGAPKSTGVEGVPNPLAGSGAAPRQNNIAFNLFLLLIAALLAVMVALPQLVPTRELIDVSNRGGGLTRQQATAFSLEPALVGRGLLPSYAGQPFSEYVAYVGVAGLILLALGAAVPDRRRWPWLALLALGLLLALGRHNPLYWALAGLPGFDLFRVPARWLALFALAAAMLAGLGLQNLMANRGVRHGVLSGGVAAVAALALASLLSGRAAELVDGPAVPTAITWAGWGAALIACVLLALWSRRRPRLAGGLIAALVVVELWAASHELPFNDATDPAVYRDSRFAIDQLRAYGLDDLAPGRLLSISGLLFDPGDRAALEARWSRLGLGERAAAYAFTATKMQETLAANLPLRWGVPSIDGFDGGVLPTTYYTAFAALLLPADSPPTIDGRLREMLAQPECRGACLPPQRWLDLSGTRWLLLDKVYDRVHEGIFYDTGLPVELAAGESSAWANVQAFEGDELHALYVCAADDCAAPESHDSALALVADGAPVIIDGLALARYRRNEAAAPESFALRAVDPLTLHALTWVDTRTGDFVQLAPPGWQRVYSADVKIYENLSVMPRAFVVHAAQIHSGDDDSALAMMRDPDFDPRRVVILHDDSIQPVANEAAGESAAHIVAYDATRVVVWVEAAAPGWLVLTDAYYPGWQAMLDGEPVPLHRANLMFRAVPVPAGTYEIVFTFGYGPRLTLLLVGSGLLALALLVVAAWKAYHSRPRAAIGHTTST